MQEEPTKRASTVILVYYLCHSYKASGFVLAIITIITIPTPCSSSGRLKKTGNNEIILEITEIQGGQCLKCKWEGHEEQRSQQQPKDC